MGYGSEDFLERQKNYKIERINAVVKTMSNLIPLAVKGYNHSD